MTERLVYRNLCLSLVGVLFVLVTSLVVIALESSKPTNGFKDPTASGLESHGPTHLITDVNPGSVNRIHDPQSARGRIERTCAGMVISPASHGTRTCPMCGAVYADRSIRFCPRHAPGVRLTDGEHPNEGVAVERALLAAKARKSASIETMATRRACPSCGAVYSDPGIRFCAAHDPAVRLDRR